MKILMTADTVGGVWTYALQLAQALAEGGVRVALATMGAPLSPAGRAEVAGLHGLELYESTYRLEWMAEPWPDVRRAGAWLLDLEARLRPDIVHLNGYAHGDLPWRAPTMVVGHSCVLSWWRAVRGATAPPEYDRYRRAARGGLRAADLVAAPTAAMLAALAEHYGPLDAGCVLPNGRDPRLFTPGEKEPFVLAVGRLWDEAKNVGTLASIAPRLAWPVYMAGEARHPDGGRARFAGVRALGHLTSEALAGWYARAAIYALPARYEPFGLSALEAGLAGCALVLGDIPSLREVWDEAAVFVTPEDPEALRAALEGLIADSTRRRVMARRARARALTYTAERMADGYLAAYRQLLTRRQRARVARVAAARTGRRLDAVR